MKTKKLTFALFFKNWGEIPASLQANAREELPWALKTPGHNALMPDGEATRYGAVAALKPHTVHSTSHKFKENTDDFDRVCRVVRSVKRMVVDAIGARASAFKTVRYNVALHVARTGRRRYISITRGHHPAPVREAPETYLGIDVAVPQEMLS